MIKTKHPSNKILTEQDLNRIADDIYVGRTDYFYIPIFYSTFSSSDNAERNFVVQQFPEFAREVNDVLWFTLRYSNEDSPEALTKYASKVPADSTLQETLRNDLTRDFNYPESAPIFIGDGGSYWMHNDDTFIRPYDTVATEDRQELSRILVMVGVDMFDVSNIAPAGTHPFWKYEGDDYINLASIYYMGLLKDSYINHADNPESGYPISKNALRIAEQFPDYPPYRVKT